jgi:hypothetical protein
MMRGRERRARVLAAAVFGALALAGPARAAIDPGGPDTTAAITGTAIASGAFAPVNVNPNVQLYPAYSFSETYNDSSHTLSAGVYPGFLADAAAAFYGYGPEERATLGIAESQWPNPPQSTDAGFTSFGDKCPFLATDVGLPDSFADTCTAYWAQYGASFPAHLATATARSGAQSSAGTAAGTGLIVPGGVTVGSFEASTSTQRAPDGRTVTSAAGVVLGDVTIGPLSIKQIRSGATATSGGTAATAKSTRQLEIVGATFGPFHEPVIIDDGGVHTITDTGPVQDLTAPLALLGFDVRTVHGGRVVTAGETAADSGALVVQWSGSSPPAPLQAPSNQLCNAEAIAHDTIAGVHKTVTGIDHTDLSFHRDNPLRQPNPISQTVNPLTGHAVSDPNGRPLTLVDPTLGADQTLPPVLPCLDFLLQRNVNVGFALGSAFADATFRALPVVAAAGFDASPGRTFSSTLTVLGPDTGSAVGPGAPLAGGVRRVRRTTVATGGLGRDVAGRVRLLYGVILALPPTLLAGRRTFRLLVRT